MPTDTEQLILTTARRHFVRNGYAGARMQQIADEAGINKAMLHYYFRSKDKLYQEILGSTLDMVIPKFTNAVNIEGTIWDKIEAFIETYITALSEHPDIPLFIMSELAQKREQFIAELKKRSVHFPAAQAFIGQLMAEMQAGNIRKMNPLHLFLNIVGMTVFPFIARPVFQTIFEFPDSHFAEMMEERKTILLEFVRNALRVD